MTNPRENQDRTSSEPAAEKLSARTARIYEQHYRERYNLERDRLAERIDLGGKEGA